MSQTGTIDRIPPGRRFGMLTVEADTGQRKNRYAVWRCRCDCGGEIDASTKELKNKKIRDCGCTTHVGYGANDQTGQLNWPIPVLAISGAVLFILGWCLTRSDRKRTEYPKQNCPSPLMRWTLAACM